MIAIPKKLKLENLEDRICLDGNVAVTIEQLPGYAGNTAIFTGDSLANTIQIVQTDRNDYTALGAAFGEFDTTLNGSDQIQLQNISNFLFDLKGGDDFLFVNGDPNHDAPQEVTVDGVFKFFGMGGNDNLLVEDSKFRGNFYADLGPGNNFFQSIDSRHIGETHVRAAGGNDFFGTFRSNFHSDFFVRAAGGNDLVMLGSAENDLQGSRFLSSLNLSLGNGDDVNRIDNSVIKGDTSIRLGNGRDWLTANKSRINTYDDVRVWTGNGDDSVHMDTTKISADSIMVRTGNGKDHFEAKNLKYRGVGTKQFTIDGGRHDDQINFSNSSVDGNIKVRGSFGRDIINFSATNFGIENNRWKNANQKDGSTGSSLDINGGGGPDHVSLLNLIISQIDFSPVVEFTKVEETRIQNLDLVISQTQDVHEKIEELLEQLRRLQDLQVTIEVNFITLNDSFFERIGVDFDFDINDKTDVGDTGSVRMFKNNNIRNTFDYELKVNGDGLTYSVNDYYLKSNSNVPDFGAFQPSVGLNVGLAILSDIEVFFLIQASKEKQARDAQSIMLKVTPRIILEQELDPDKF